MGDAVALPHRQAHTRRGRVDRGELGAMVATWWHQPRQVVRVGLGLIWLLDAALQYQPYMFTKAFPSDVIAGAASGSPHWVTGPSDWAANLMNGHEVVWNAVFATVQLAIAGGVLLFRRGALLKLALAGSIVWALLVWWLGEALGSLWGGPLSPLSGPPGGALLYVVIALIVWPRPADRLGVDGTRRARPEGSLAMTSVMRPFGAALSWAGLWALFVFESLRPGDRSPSALHAMVIGMQDGEPHPLAAFDRFAAKPFANTGTEWSIGLAVLCALIGIGVFLPRFARLTVIVSVVLSFVFIWVIGENFGFIFTGEGTDPNTGPLLVLWAVAFWPRPPVRVAPVQHVG